MNDNTKGFNNHFNGNSDESFDGNSDRNSDKNFKRYILFWFGGSVSLLGSSMTSFALILWAYTKTNSALSVSVMTFCSYLPYIVVSLAAGGFVDRHSKKAIMLVVDTAAAVCSFTVLLLCMYDCLEIWHIYLVNAVIGVMNSFQSPAQSVAVGLLVPKKRLSQASGMDSFSSNMVTVVSPFLASSLFAFGGLKIVIAADLISFLFNALVLLFFIRLPEHLTRSTKKDSSGSFLTGFHFIWENKGIFYIMVTMAVLNFFSRLTYENILSPMILARSQNNAQVLGSVTAILGIGGIIGGCIVSVDILKISNVRKIYFAAAFSFLFGDLLMGLGQNMFWWSVAAMASSLPIPFISAGQRVILYETVPLKLQGNVFAVRNAMQFCTIPIGILLGGILADYVFEPFMRSDSVLADMLGKIVGSGAGSGMAVMFLCTGILGFTFSCIAYRSREIQKLDNNGD